MYHHNYAAKRLNNSTPEQKAELAAYVAALRQRQTQARPSHHAVVVHAHGRWAGGRRSRGTVRSRNGAAFSLRGVAAIRCQSDPPRFRFVLPFQAFVLPYLEIFLGFRDSDFVLLAPGFRNVAVSSLPC